MTIRSVTGNIKDLAGVSIPNATFSLLPETYAFGSPAVGDTVFGDQVTVLSDSFGGVAFDLHEGKYIGRISTTQGPKTFRLVVDSEGPWTLGRLIDVSIGEITPSLIQQAFDAAQDATQSAIDAADASRLGIGTVDGGATAAATITGVAGSQLLNLVLPTGPAGQGVAPGGTGGQVLAKASATDFDTAWVDNPEPPELTTAQATDPGSEVFGVVSGQRLRQSVESAVLDEDDFASNSATRPPSQQSAKAYVDAGPKIKAWANFNGTGTVSIRESFNVSSITDNGVGDYTINFATAMPDANYSFSGSAAGADGVSFPSFVSRDHNTTQTSSALQIITPRLNAGENQVGYDSEFVQVAVFR